MAVSCHVRASIWIGLLATHIQWQPPGWWVILTIAGIPVEGKSPVCLICINNYRIVILITGVLSLSAWVKYCYRILQTHHARTRAHACAHTCAQTCTHRRRRLTAVQVIAIRWHPTNHDGPLRLRQCRSLAIQMNTRTGDPIYPRFWKFFAYKKIARTNWDANSWQDVRRYE